MGKSNSKNKNIEYEANIELNEFSEAFSEENFVPSPDFVSDLEAKLVEITDESVDGDKAGSERGIMRMILPLSTAFLALFVIIFVGLNGFGNPTLPDPVTDGTEVAINGDSAPDNTTQESAADLIEFDTAQASVRLTDVNLEGNHSRTVNTTFTPGAKISQCTGLTYKDIEAPTSYTESFMQAGGETVRTKLVSINGRLIEATVSGTEIDNPASVEMLQYLGGPYFLDITTPELEEPMLSEQSSQPGLSNPEPRIFALPFETSSPENILIDGDLEIRDIDGEEYYVYEHEISDTSQLCGDNHPSNLIAVSTFKLLDFYNFETEIYVSSISNSNLVAKYTDSLTYRDLPEETTISVESEMATVISAPYQVVEVDTSYASLTDSEISEQANEYIDRYPFDIYIVDGEEPGRVVEEALIKVDDRAVNPEYYGDGGAFEEAYRSDLELARRKTEEISDIAQSLSTLKILRSGSQAQYLIFDENSASDQTIVEAVQDTLEVRDMSDSNGKLSIDRVAASVDVYTSESEGDPITIYIFEYQGRDFAVALPSDEIEGEGISVTITDR